jgi:hypothetical protein
MVVKPVGAQPPEDATNGGETCQRVARLLFIESKYYKN